MPLNTWFIFKKLVANKGDKVLEIVLSHNNSVEAIAHIFFKMFTGMSWMKQIYEFISITLELVSVDEYTVEVILIIGSEIIKLNVLAPTT